MFGRKAFGRKSASQQVDRVRRDLGGGERLIDREIWNGATGELLRGAGLAPDDPINSLAKQEPVSATLAEGLADLRRAVAAVNGVVPYPIGALHLLPPVLWHGRFGPFLLKRLDMSPYRPWNTIFLPLDAHGVTALELPICPTDGLDDATELETQIEMVADLYAGRAFPEAEKISLLLDTICGNFPQLFPVDTRDFSDTVRRARMQMRALAFSRGATLVGKDAILNSQATFLSQPEVQLTA
jgi:hypothetical protein